MPSARASTPGSTAQHATITVASAAPGGPLAVASTGTGTQVQLSPSPPALEFGARDIDIGATLPLTSTLTNIGIEPVAINAIGIAGADAPHFQRLATNVADCSTRSTNLAPGQTCTLRAHFDPSTTGDKTATLTVSSNAAEVTVALTGTGTQTQLSRSPETLAFGDRDIDDGPAAVRTSTVTNSGTEPVSLSAVTLTGTSEFVRLTSQAGDCTATTTLGASETCELRVEFDPATTGTKAATLTITSDARARPRSRLTGTGIQTSLAVSPAGLAVRPRSTSTTGGTASQSSVVTNTGTQPVSLTGGRDRR